MCFHLELDEVEDDFFRWGYKQLSPALKSVLRR